MNIYHIDKTTYINIAISDISLTNYLKYCRYMLHICGRDICIFSQYCNHFVGIREPSQHLPG